MGIDTSLHLPDTPLLAACASAVESVPNKMCEEGEHFYDTPIEWCQGPGLNTKMIEIFESMYLYDEYIGHYLWLLLEFLCFYLVFRTAFVPIGTVEELPPVMWYMGGGGKCPHTLVNKRGCNLGQYKRRARNARLFARLGGGGKCNALPAQNALSIRGKRASESATHTRAVGTPSSGRVARNAL